MEENKPDYAAMYAKQANDLAQKAYDEQQKAIQLGVDKVVSDINYQKDVAKEDELKEAKSAYADYAKQINPYGVEKEAIVGMGLNGSGYQESSKVNMNNTYQNRVSKAVDTTRRLFADYNNQINQAKMEGNIQMAKALADQYQFQIENLWRGFDLQYKQDRDAINDKRYEQEWAYQQSRDAVSDNRYNQEWEYQKKRDEIQDSRYLNEWERQLALDRLDEEHWQKEYALQQKKTSASSGSGSRGTQVLNSGEINLLQQSNNSTQSSNPFVAAWDTISKDISAASAIRNMSTDQFKSYLSNAYKNNQISKDEVDKLLKIRGV